MSANSRQHWRIVNDLLHNDLRDTVDLAIYRKMCDVLADYHVSKLLSIEEMNVDRLAANLFSALPRTDVTPPLQQGVFDVVTEIDGCRQRTSRLDVMPTSLLKTCSVVFTPLICWLPDHSFPRELFQK